MLVLIDGLIKYLNTAITTSILIDAEKKVGEKFLRVISVNIIDWLRLEHKRNLWIKEGKVSISKPLKLNYNYPWCQYLKKLIKEDVNFGMCFTIQEDEFYYNERIDNDTREKACTLAMENYRPIEFITKKEND